MILADTSAWIEYDRATGSAVDERMTGLVARPGELALTEPVIMEVLAGARSTRREQDLRRLLGRYDLLPFDAVVDFDGAVRTYRRCRANGVTPRGLIDCLIASVAHRHHARLLARDSDLTRVAQLVGLDLDEASLSS